MKSFMTLDEFKNFTPEKPCYALIGYPLSHSLSPALHDFLFTKKGIDACYVAIEVPPERFDEAIAVFRQKLSGFNITLPYKTDIIPHLDEIHENAKLLQSVNTVKIENSKFYGFNTDINGIEHSFKLDKVKIRGKNFALLGYGGVSRTLAHFALQNGAKLHIYGRNEEKLTAFAKMIAESYPKANIKTTVGFELSENTQIIANGTSVGLHNTTECPISSIPEKTEYVFDTIYVPLKTKLIKLAEEKELKSRNGISMLALQGIKAQEIWLNIKFDKKISIRAITHLLLILLKKELSSMEKRPNISLIGFMASGKTTIGKKLAKLLSYEFIDADVYLEKQQKMTIPEIFEKYGEEHFRKLETEVLNELKSKDATIISTGGGAPLRPQNVKILKSCSKIIFLDLPLKIILKTLEDGGKEKRPIVAQKGLDGISELHSKRHPIYFGSCDYRVTKGNIHEILQNILENF